MTSTITLLLTTLSSAQALGYIEAWSYDFSDGDEVGGSDGWINGYDQDPWEGYVSSSTGFSYAQSTTDDNVGDDEDSIDNWLVYEDADWNDALFLAWFYNEDDDTGGLVFQFQDPENYYLVVTSRGSVPYELDIPATALIKVTDGEAEVLAVARDEAFDSGQLSAIAIQANDGEISAFFWYSYQDVGASEPDITLTADDPDPLGAGYAGFYAYDSGGTGDEFFLGEPVVLLLDDDDDGVADDEDNCEFDANEDQEDNDDDGIGNVCDETPDGDGGGGEGDDTGGGGEGDDTGGGTGAEGDDTGGGTGAEGDDTGVDLGQIDQGEVKLGSSCSAAGGGRAGAAGWLLLGLGLLIGRRRS